MLRRLGRSLVVLVMLALVGGYAAIGVFFAEKFEAFLIQVLQYLHTKTIVRVNRHGWSGRLGHRHRHGRSGCCFVFQLEHALTERVRPEGHIYKVGRN